MQGEGIEKCALVELQNFLPTPWPSLHLKHWVLEPRILQEILLDCRLLDVRRVDAVYEVEDLVDILDRVLHVAGGECGVRGKELGA